MNQDQINLKMTQMFHKQMMRAPQVPLNLLFYKDLLASVLEKFLVEFDREDITLVEKAAAKLGDEFVWFNAGTEKDNKDGGYYRNINSPEKLYGKELYKVLGITNNKQEQEMADKLYGTGK